jgi:hypothetical protein
MSVARSGADLSVLWRYAAAPPSAEGWRAGEERTSAIAGIEYAAIQHQATEGLQGAGPSRLADCAFQCSIPIGEVGRGTVAALQKADEAGFRIGR